jgi:tRNA pseudouridine55 synthase
MGLQSYSALRHEGKRYYEYAREGKPLPKEIVARPLTVDHLELLDFTTDHQWSFPEREASEEEKLVGAALEKGQTEETPVEKVPEKEQMEGTPAEKALKHDLEDKDDDDVSVKKSKIAASSENSEPAGESSSDIDPSAPQNPPAITIRMTVSSGFYVRSLIHEYFPSVPTLYAFADGPKASAKPLDPQHTW